MHGLKVRLTGLGKDIRLLTKLEDMKSTIISLDVTFSYNLDHLVLSHFAGHSEEIRMLLFCLSQLLAMCSEKNLAPRCPS